MADFGLWFSSAVWFTKQHKGERTAVYGKTRIPVHTVNSFFLCCFQIGNETKSTYFLLVYKHKWKMGWTKCKPIWKQWKTEQYLGLILHRSIHLICIEKCVSISVCLAMFQAGFMKYLKVTLGISTCLFSITKEIIQLWRHNRAELQMYPTL